MRRVAQECANGLHHLFIKRACEFARVASRRVAQRLPECVNGIVNHFHCAKVLHARRSLPAYDVSCVTGFSKRSTIAFRFRIEWAISNKFHQRSIGWNCSLYRFESDRLRLRAEFIAISAYLSFEFLFLFLLVLDRPLIIVGSHFLRAVQNQTRELRRGLVQLVEQRLILGVETPLQRRERVSHRI